MKSGQKHDIVEQYIDQFDGDVVAAVKAIQEFTHEEYAVSRVSKREVSDEVMISVSNLTKQYKKHRQKIPALDGVSLNIHSGEFVALTGPSGSGKSTLLQLIGGLDKPTSGKVIVNAIDISELSDRKLSEFRNKTVGFVFQFFYLQPFLTLDKNIEVPGMFARRPSDERRTRALEIIEQVGLGERVGHLPKELSGGQLQRAAIARALLNNPRVLLADEPTGNLDSKNGKAIIDLFEKIRTELGTTIVIVTHDREIATRADREVRLRDGAIV